MSSRFTILQIEFSAVVIRSIMTAARLYFHTVPWDLQYAVDTKPDTFQPTESFNR